VVATTSWVVALCLVVGAIALVAGATGPSRLHANSLTPSKLNLGVGGQVTLPGAIRHTGPHTSSVRHKSEADQPQPPTSSTNLLRPSRASTRPMVFTFHGTASWFHMLKLRKVVATGKWQLNWSYSCPANKARGSFAVSDLGSAAAQAISINQSSPGGNGTTLLEPDGRTPQLAVTASCPWTVQVVGHP
jgi:hypothetical protein